MSKSDNKLFYPICDFCKSIGKESRGHNIKSCIVRIRSICDYCNQNGHNSVSCEIKIKNDKILAKQQRQLAWTEKQNEVIAPVSVTLSNAFATLDSDSDEEKEDTKEETPVEVSTSYLKKIDEFIKQKWKEDTWGESDWASCKNDI
jgi:hypothetical protein